MTLSYPRQGNRMDTITLKPKTFKITAPRNAEPLQMLNIVTTQTYVQTNMTWACMQLAVKSGSAVGKVSVTFRICYPTHSRTCSICKFLMIYLMLYMLYSAGRRASPRCGGRASLLRRAKFTSETW